MAYKFRGWTLTKTKEAIFNCAEKARYLLGIPKRTVLGVGSGPLHRWVVASTKQGGRSETKPSQVLIDIIIVAIHL